MPRRPRGVPRPTPAVGYPRAVPELPEVETLPPAGRAGPRAHRSPRCATPDAWFLKGGADRAGAAPGPGRAPVHRPPAARQALLLDIDGRAPTSGIRVRHDRHPGGRRAGGRRPAALLADARTTRRGTGSPLALRRRRVAGRPRPPAPRRGDPRPRRVRARTRRRHRHPGRAGRGPARASAAPLKARLLDQSRVAGVGNLIADEILWRAGALPAPARRLADAGRGAPAPPAPACGPSTT